MLEHLKFNVILLQVWKRDEINPPGQEEFIVESLSFLSQKNSWKDFDGANSLVTTAWAWMKQGSF